MKITEVRLYRHALERAAVYKPGEDHPVDSTIVELVTDSGISGWGEACPLRNTFAPVNTGQIVAAIELLAPAVLGLDPRHLVSVHRAMDGAMNGTNEARSAIDIACWDIAGKASGQRVCDLLGGAVDTHVPTYLVVRIVDGPETAAARVVELQDDGVTKIQVKATGEHLDEIIAAAHAIDAVRRPGTDVFVDANRGWTRWDAIAFSQACADLTLAIEQPCDTYAQCADVRPHLRHPMLLDESAVDLETSVRAITTGVADGFGTKISRLGGLTPMRAFLDVCRATSTPTSCDDSWGGDIVAAACVHAAATLDPRLSRGAWIPEPYVAGHYDDINGPRIEGGRIAVPTGPGLGLDISGSMFGEPAGAWS